jgi:peptidoglycan/LPS O-acetylase OafA/YrhL
MAIHQATGGNDARAKSSRVPQLDVVRGISILMVMLAHQEAYPAAHSIAYFPITFLNAIGWAGVDIFFVLSGFLVGGLLIREYQVTGTLVPSRFLIRRAFKVWPPYFLFLFAYAAAQLLTNRSDLSRGARAVHLITHLWPNLLQIQNYSLLPIELTWLWSLGVEEHFYLLLPWALTAIFGLRLARAPRSTLNVGRRMAICFLLVAAVCLAMRGITAAFLAPITMSDRDIYDLVFPTHLRIDSLFCGVFLAYLAHFHALELGRLRPYRGLLLCVSLSVGVLFYVKQGGLAYLYLYPYGTTILYLGAACLVLWAHLASQKASAPRGSTGIVFGVPGRVMAWLGVRSYSIYVWHGYFAKPLANRATRLLHLPPGEPGLRGWAYDILYLLADAFVGALMFRLIEVPALRLRKRFAPPVVLSGGALQADRAAREVLAREPVLALAGGRGADPPVP